MATGKIIDTDMAAYDAVCLCESFNRHFNDNTHAKPL